MKKNIITIILLWVFILAIKDDFLGNSYLEKYQPAPKKASKNEKDYENTFVNPYLSNHKEPNLDSLQCPIPKKDRVKNYTGIQCVYSSIEMLGRWAEEPKLTNPSITSRKECKGYSGPKQAAYILNNLKVKFEQTWGNREKGLELIKKAMKEGRGCLWDVPGHAMVLIHYDESQNKVCWVDNSDYSLRVQQTTVDRFKQRWNSWVLVIYADNDIIKYKKVKINLPIFENGIIKKYPKDFIPIPNF